MIIEIVSLTGARNVQFRVLYREFLFRIVDLEVLAPQGDVSKLAGQSAALLKAWERTEFRSPENRRRQAFG
jgi:hypothetical protein